MAKKLDLIGQIFAALTIIEFAEIRNKKSYWRCLCKCGKEAILLGSDIKRGHHQSCGCFYTTQIKSINRPLYEVWKGMRARCRDEKHIAYKNYGARGIKVCEEWNDFKVFNEWAMNAGWKKRLQIDRIDNDGNYEPSNCRILTSKDNSRRSRKSKMTMEIAQEIRNSDLPTRYFAEKYNVTMGCIHHIKRGLTWV